MTVAQIVLILVAFYVFAGLIVRMIVMQAGSVATPDDKGRNVYLANTAGMLWPLFIAIGLFRSDRK
jgi:hypothetical protein